MDILKLVLEKFTGADYWIVASCLLAVFLTCLWLGTTSPRKQKVLLKQIGFSALLLFLAAVVIWLNHIFFQREPVFAEGVNGILVMRIVGDDALNSLQGDLVENLNSQLQMEPAGLSIEVHAGTGTLDTTNGIAATHQRARRIGKSLKAKLVIWGRKGTEKKFYPRITMVEEPKNWGVRGERTLKGIDDVQLPEELVDQPFYLIHFAAGYTFFAGGDAVKAAPHFAAALRRKGASPDELADLQSFAADCSVLLSFKEDSSEKDSGANLHEAITLLEKAAEAYKNKNPERWARTVNNLGIAHLGLKGESADHVKKAIAAFESTLGIFAKKESRIDWADTNVNLCVAYSEAGDDASNVQQAVLACEAAQQVYTEKDYPIEWAMTELNIGNAYERPLTIGAAEHLPKAVAAYQAALRVYSETNFPIRWADVQHNLCVAYQSLPTGNEDSNLESAIGACDAATRVYTEQRYPATWARIQNHLGKAYGKLLAGDRATNLRKAVSAYQAALRVNNEKHLLADWALTQFHFALFYLYLSEGNRTENLQKAEDCFEAALTDSLGEKYPEIYAADAIFLADVKKYLRTRRSK